uniref:Semaphorin 4D n=1 Tax=Bos indicus x Bos taurus TaxID=30522 RepID=A0A4W2FX81_BOBOX
MRMCGPVGGLLTALAVVFGTAVAFAPVPRITWEHREVQLVQFHEPGIFNYSALLLSENEDTLFVGAREAVFALNAHNISKKQHEAYWKVSEDKKARCAEKGKSKQTECLNYIRVLQPLSTNALYVCGTNAFQPACDHLNLTSFKFLGKNEDGKGRCPFDPAQSYTSVMVDGELYSGTSYNFLGSEPIISRNSTHSPLRTEYAIPWLNEPSFVFADVVRESPEGEDLGDDRVYFFFTEVSVEYEFVFKLMIPRIARVCKGDQGGLRTLQKKWTSFLKARLICSRPDSNLVFNVLRDVFVLRSADLKEPVFYGVFTPQLNNVGLSAVCAYNLSTAEAVFSRGKYMQSATVEQSHTKWVRYNGAVPTPRPGACINREARAANFSSSLNLPDKTLQFVKDHPLMDDSVTPIDSRPRLIKGDVNYTQIVVDRARALDGTIHDVMFVSTDRGALHKAISLENDIHIIEETQLFQDFEPIQSLLLSSKKGRKFVYAGSNSGVVQAPVAFCGKHGTCEDCVLARDPYCAWSPAVAACVALHQTDSPSRGLIQEMNGDASTCPGPADVHFLWEKNGRELEVCVPTQTHALPDGRALVLSWLRDALRESAEYRCSALSRAGNKTSKARVTVTRLANGHLLSLMTTACFQTPCSEAGCLCSRAAHVSSQSPPGSVVNKASEDGWFGGQSHPSCHRAASPPCQQRLSWITDHPRCTVTRLLAQHPSALAVGLTWGGCSALWAGPSPWC